MFLCLGLGFNVSLLRQRCLSSGVLCPGSKISNEGVRYVGYISGLGVGC